MTYHDIPVRPISQEDLEKLANGWRALVTPNTDGSFDILTLYKAARVDLIPLPNAYMGDDLARAAAASNRVFIRKSHLERVELGDEDAHWDLLHELGHVALHRGPEMKARKIGGNLEERFISDEESAEDQAWRFARAVRIPLLLVRQLRSAERISQLCNVHIDHASKRLREASVLLSKMPLAAVAELLPKKSHAELREIQRANEARELLRIWNTAQRIPGDRMNSRMCSQGKWRVIWAEFNMMTECGWVLRERKIVAWKNLEG